MGHLLSYSGDRFTFWPPAGIVLAAFLTTSPRHWPTIAAAALFADLIGEAWSHDKYLPLILVDRTAHMVTATVGAMIIQHLVGTPFRLDRPP